MEEEAQEEVKVYSSFRDMVSDPQYNEMYCTIPALTYYLYAAGADLLKEGAMTTSVNECLRKVLVSIEMPDKPTIEELEADAEGKLHFKLNDYLAPSLIMMLVDKMETNLKANTKARTLH